MLKNKILSILLATTMMVFSACSGGGGGSSKSDDTLPNNSKVSYELADKTKVVEKSNAEQMIVVPEINASNYQDNLDFRVPKSGAFLDYEVGDTLMSGVSDKAPNGFLRKIVSIDTVNGELVFTTEQARLLEATNNIDIDYRSGTISTKNIRSINLANGVTLENMELDKKGVITRSNQRSGGALFDISIDKTLTHNGGEITISGRTTFDFGIFFKLETEYLVVPEIFRAGIEIDQGTKISVVSQNGITYQEDISLGSINLAPITLSAVVIVPTVELVLKVNGEVQANFSVMASESFHGELGVEYIDGRDGSDWAPIATKEFKTDFVPPNLDDGGAKLKVGAGPEFSMLIYGVVGPYMNVGGFGELDASVTTAPNLNLSLDVGVEYALGVKVDILWVDATYKFANSDLFRISILKLKDEPIPDGIYLTNPMDNELILFGPSKIISATYSGTLPDKVEFLLDDVSLEEDSTKPFEFSWDTSGSTLGTHTIKVISYDSGGAEIKSDSSEIELREAKWRGSVNVDDVSVIGHSDFIYNTGYVFGLNESATSGSSVIKKTTDGGKTWSMFLNEPIGLNGSIPLAKGLIGNSGNIIGLEQLSTNLYSIDENGRKPIYGDDFVFDFGLNSSSDIIAVMQDDNETFYVAQIDDLGNVSNRYDIKDADGNIMKVGKARIEFSKVSDDAIVFTRSFVDNGNVDDNVSVVQSYMISKDKGATWTYEDYGADISFDFMDTVEAASFISENEIVLVGTTYAVSDEEYDPNNPDDYLPIYAKSAFVLKTTDGGTTWQRVDVPSAKGFGSVTFFSDKEGFASVSVLTHKDIAEPKVYKTVDGGLTWSPVEEVTTKERIVRVQFSSKYSGVAVGDEGSVFRFSLD